MHSTISMDRRSNQHRNSVISGISISDYDDDNWDHGSYFSEYSEYSNEVYGSAREPTAKKESTLGRSLLKGVAIIGLFYAVASISLILGHKNKIQQKAPDQCRVWVIGDGVCDDEENFGGCSFDGGDCCLPSISSAHQKCTACICHSTISPCSLTELGLNNGVCNDELNNDKCWHDFGDCCFSISSEFCSKCECKVPDEVLMVAGGNANDFIDLEIIKFGGYHTCDTMKTSVPAKKLFGDIFQLVDFPFLCSGANYSTCYDIFGAFHDQLDLHIDPRVDRSTSSSVSLESDTIWTTGGTIKSNGLYNSFSTLLFITSRNKWMVKKGIDLPVGMSHHCSLNIDNNRILLVGGYKTFSNPSSKNLQCEDYHRDTYIYHRDTNSWAKGPKTLQIRAEFICGTMRSQFHNGEYITVIAGGIDLCEETPSVLKSTEILSNTETGFAWKLGPDLPAKLKGGKGVTSSDWSKLIHVGGTTEGQISYPGLLEFSCSISSCIWKQFNVSLILGNRGSTSIQLKIPRKLTTCFK